VTNRIIGMIKRKEVCMSEKDIGRLRGGERGTNDGLVGARIKGSIRV